MRTLTSEGSTANVTQDIAVLGIFGKCRLEHEYVLAEHRDFAGRCLD